MKDIHEKMTNVWHCTCIMSHATEQVYKLAKFLPPFTPCGSVGPSVSHSDPEALQLEVHWIAHEWMNSRFNLITLHSHNKRRKFVIENATDCFLFSLFTISIPICTHWMATEIAENFYWMAESFQNTVITHSQCLPNLLIYQQLSCIYSEKN